MNYPTVRSQRPETQVDTERELMDLYNRGDMAEHPGMFIRKPETRLLKHDSDVWRV